MIVGTYKTPKERQNTGSSQHSHVFGTANPEDANSTGAFFLNWNNGDSITAWTGVCSGVLKTGTILPQSFHAVMLAVPKNRCKVLKRELVRYNIAW